MNSGLFAFLNFRYSILSFFLLSPSLAPFTYLLWTIIHFSLSTFLVLTAAVYLFFSGFLSLTSVSRFHHMLSAPGQCTVLYNSQESGGRYWPTHLSARSFACSAHSFACSALLALLARSAAPTRSLLGS